jgi:hypothetical protein
VLPWSSVSQRPFFYPIAAEAHAEAARSLFFWAAFDCMAIFALLLLSSCAARGFLEDEVVQLACCLGVLMCVVGMNVVMWIFNFEVLANIDVMSAYYSFYDALPTSDGHVLPLQWVQAQRLFDGPPHPAALVVSDGLSAFVLFLSSAFWVGMYAQNIFIGMTYAAMADPFEELRVRLAAEGRVPTPEEYLKALTQAAISMDAGQLELLKRKMQKRSSHD